MNVSEVNWRKSSRSLGDKEECVEVAAVWRRSRRSLGNNDNCVEVAALAAEAVAIRDSKDPAGPVHLVSTGAFGALLTSIKSGDLDF
ncbi:DUF397 domain-containing protein [Actinomadura craniellae]|uniref:DUF397 domain-containing protein n=1 Tax=Actinomadura craniellae TaxID=2231787 RepID=A0A365H733_9ACTN|nr:DUF397 domain-containing protein [Actinomadura craniellae]RAY14934.1 DUF397 domain-containing protein [Actinomadura craniellae]